MPKRRTHPPEFKAQVALDALCSKKTLAEVAASYELHPVQVCQWKQQALKRLPELFQQMTSGNEEHSAEELSQRLARLERANADLAEEIQWLKKKFHSYDQLILRSLLEPAHPSISLRRQCKLIGVTRSSYYYRPVPVAHKSQHLAHYIDQLCGVEPRISQQRLLSRLSEHGFPLCKKTLHRLLCRLGFAPFEQKLTRLLQARLLQIPPLPVCDEAFDREGEQWILDVAYWPSPQGDLFASLVVDGRTHHCLAWGLSDRLSPALMIHLLRGAMQNHPLPLLLRCETFLPFVSSRCLGGLARAGINVVRPFWPASLEGVGRATALASLWTRLKEAAVLARTPHASRREASILDQVVREANERRAQEREFGKDLSALGLDPAGRTPEGLNDWTWSSRQAEAQARSFTTPPIPLLPLRRPGANHWRTMG
jgi:putative transposase